MKLEKQPFTSYKLEEERSSKNKTFTIWLNEDEQKMLSDAQEILEQPKQSTALKQLAILGYNLLGDSLTGSAIKLLFKNKRNNKRTGVVDFD